MRAMMDEMLNNRVKGERKMNDRLTWSKGKGGR